ncbi:HEPN domain-containing protein [Agromyces sp. SYSU T00194]|uniref:HEPN domain-containing protein n=1 Tax=Agromyces chitinivorans TaxID=3158560 RepID=UPI003394E1B6
MADATPVIRRMLATGRLERIAVNPGHADELIATARRHLETARLLARTDDVAMAFTAAYDGTRKALTAVLASEGLRVRPMGGAHRNTGLAAAEFLAEAADALAEFEWMRQVRNGTEYPSPDQPTAVRADVPEAIAAGEAIVAACAAWLAGRS